MLPVKPSNERRELAFVASDFILSPLNIVFDRFNLQISRLYGCLGGLNINAGFANEVA